MDFLKWKKKRNTSFLKIYIISSLLPNFLLKLFSNFSLSGYYFSGGYRTNITYGIMVFSKNYSLEKNCLKNKNQIFNFFQFIISKIQTKFNFLIFTRNFSELISIRNILQKLKKKIDLKIKFFNEYRKKHEKGKFDDPKIQITLITERSFFFSRVLYEEFDSIYFHSYPLNKEFYYELARQARI